jgi:hypothetical protein
MSKRAIEIFKSKTTLEERKRFVVLITEYNRKNYKHLNRKLEYKNNDLFYILTKLYWCKITDSYNFKWSLFDRFTEEELNTPFDINELKQK